jgi:hypothetical protein
MRALDSTPRLCAPCRAGQRVAGVVQFLHNRRGGPFINATSVTGTSHGAAARRTPERAITQRVSATPACGGVTRVSIGTSAEGHWDDRSCAGESTRREECQMSLVADGSFADQERASLQPLAPTLAAILTQALPAPLEWPSDSAFSVRERANLIARITLAQQTAAAAVKAFAADARDSGDAGRKAAAWGVVGTATVAILVAVLAVVVSVFTFGSAMGSAVGILAAQSTVLGIAAQSGHPLSAELAAIIASMASALRTFAREPVQNRREAIFTLCSALEQALESLARLPGRTGAMTGPWRGDRTAVYDAGLALDDSLGRCAALLERIPSIQMDTRPAVVHILTLREAVANALRLLTERGS